MAIETPAIDTNQPPAPPSAGRRFDPIAWLRANPVVVKEFRGRMRGNRAFILLTVYLAIMAGIVGLVYLFYMASIDPAYSYGPPQTSSRQIFGKTLFGLVLGIQMFCVSLFSPALTASSITSERERQTYDLLRTTLLSERALVYGKFFSGFSFILLMLVASLPMQSLAFLFGGVAPEEVLINALLLVVTAASFCAVGIFCSSLFKNTVLSTVMAYAIPLIWVYGIPLMGVTMLSIFAGVANDLFNFSTLSATTQGLLAVGLWSLISFNPVATVIATETLLTTNQSIWSYDIPLPNGNVTVLSPWILYVALSVLITFMLLFLSMRLVRRIEN